MDESPSFAAPPSRRFWFARALLAVAVLSLALLVTTPSDAATDAGYTVELSKTTGIVDGEVIDIQVSAPPEVIPASAPVTAYIALCRPDPNATYDLHAIQRDQGNCVYDAGTVGSSDFAAGASQGKQVRDVGDLLRARGHTVIPWAMGTGIAEWSAAGRPVSLACDAGHACSMVVLLVAGGSGVGSSFVFPVTFRDSSASAACGAGSAGVSGSHPFRLAQFWNAETLAACALPGARGAPTASAANGEDENLKAFGGGEDDITFTGIGYRDPSIVEGLEGRASVAVPVALNASVLAFSGGTLDGDGRKIPYEPLKVTLDEFAQIMSGGMVFMSFPPPNGRWQPILARNPAFAQGQSSLGSTPFYPQTPVADEGITFFPMILGNGDAATWVATRDFTSVLGADWKTYPNYVVDRPVCDPPNPDDVQCPTRRGVTLSASVAQPPFDKASTINGTATLRKNLLAFDNPRSLTTQSSISVVTDAATANWLGVTPAAITSTPGGSNFVAPTPASMAAAVPGMTKDENGMRFADPTKIPAGAYPMTFVEYALVPVTPKSDAVTCTLRSWLTFLTTGGQQHLGGGVAPLTPDLQADAVEAIAKVGAGTTCAGDPAPPPPVPAPIVPGGLGGSSSYGSTGSPSSAGGSSGRSSASGSVGLESAGDEVAGGPTMPASTEPPIGVVVPDYAGSRTAGALAAVAAMALLGLLTWFAAMFSARKFPWQQAAEDETPEGPQVFAVSGSSPLDIIELD